MKPSKKYYLKNKIIITTYQRLIREENRDGDLERKRKYRNENREEINISAMVRRQEKKLNLKYSEVKNE